MKEIELPNLRQRGFLLKKMRVGLTIKVGWLEWIG
jgi:hypothetical protein